MSGKRKMERLGMKGRKASSRRKRRRTLAARQAHVGLHVRVIGVRTDQDWSPDYPAAAVKNWTEACKLYDRTNWTEGTTEWLWDEHPPAATLMARVQQYRPHLPVRLVVIHAHGDGHGRVWMGPTAVPLLEVLDAVYKWAPLRMVVMGCSMTKAMRSAKARATMARINPGPNATGPSPSPIPTFVGHGKLWVPDWGWHAGWELEQRCWFVQHQGKQNQEWSKEEWEVGQLN